MPAAGPSPRARFRGNKARGRAALYMEFEMIDILSNKHVKARKSHTCNLCKLKIEKGEVYRSAKLADGGEIWAWKEHLECSKCAIETLDDSEYEDVGMWSGREWIEHMEEWKGKMK